MTDGELHSVLADIARTARRGGYDVDEEAEVLARAVRAHVADVLADGQSRCPSCEHRAAFHQPNGCWYAVTDAKPWTTVGCNCIGWTA